MSGTPISVRWNESSEDDIREHLRACDQQYDPALSTRVDIAEYARKIRAHAFTIEAWDERLLVGLLAAYANLPNRSCYVTNVSVLPRCARTGIATLLVDALVCHVMDLAVDSVVLEVSKRSVAALRLYSRAGFRQVEDRGEAWLLQRKPRDPEGGSLPEKEIMQGRPT
jgi:ribosomal protein S18 acetylase RimI-like enzyme